MATADDFTTPVDVGNPETVTIRQLAERIISLTNSTSSVTLTGTPVVEPTQPVPNLSLIKSVTGWEPSINLDQGLQQTIDYFKKII
jgi:UDP-glucuronate decarboxylase